MLLLRTFTGRTALLAAFTACLLATPVSAQLLTFDNVATNSAGFNSTAFSTHNGYTFENFGVMTNTSVFGTGNNTASPPKFAFGQADDASFLYRTDIGFHFFSAFLSFRTLDPNTGPVDITVNGYRAGDVIPTFSQLVTLTNSAQLTSFNFLDIEEIEFDTHKLDNGRAAILALDDVNVNVVPEPSSLMLFAVGILVLGSAVARRRRRV